MGPPLIDHLLVHVLIEAIHDQHNDSLSTYLVVFNVNVDICDSSPIDRPPSSSFINQGCL